MWIKFCMNIFKTIIYLFLVVAGFKNIYFSKNGSCDFRPKFSSCFVNRRKARQFSKNRLQQVPNYSRKNIRAKFDSNRSSNVWDTFGTANMKRPWEKGLLWRNFLLKRIQLNLCTQRCMSWFLNIKIFHMKMNIQIIIFSDLSKVCM